MWETSTPLIHLRWFLYKIGFQNKLSYAIVSISAVFLFFACRIVWGYCKFRYTNSYYYLYFFIYLSVNNARLFHGLNRINSILFFYIYYVRQLIRVSALLVFCISCIFIILLSLYCCSVSFIVYV